MRNILVGYDGSRGSATALRQTIPLAEALQSRVRVVQAVEPVSPQDMVRMDEGPDPVTVVDRVEAMRSREEVDEGPLPSDPDLDAAARIVENAGITCSLQTRSGMATRVLPEQAIAMDMLVLGRHGTLRRSAVGRTAASIIYHPTVPTLLCQEEPLPLHRLLLVYEPTPSGGRALRVAGELASELNVTLDVAVPDTDRRRGEENLAYVSSALRAYHVEGERVRFNGALPEAVSEMALDMGSSMVVLGDGHSCLWPWSKPANIRAAVQVPGALSLVVP